MSGRMAAAAALLAFSAATARAQSATGLSVAMDGAQLWTSSGVPGAPAWHGPALRGEARLVLGPLLLGGDLLEGKLAPAGATGSQDVVDGSVEAGVIVWPWLEAAMVRRVRAYVADSSSERWSLWELRARAGTALAPALASYVELRWAFARSVSQAGPATGVQGGQAGLVYRAADRLGVRLSYTIDQAVLAAGGRETFESLGLGAVLTFP